MSNKKTAVIFARVACEDEEKSLLRQQVENCRQFAKENGLEVLRVFQFYGPGTKEKHIEFMSQIDDMEKRPSIVLCKSIDRFSRDVFISIQLTQFLGDYGIDIQTLDGQFINTKNLTEEEDGLEMTSVLPEIASPSHRFMKDLELSIAQFDMGMKAEKVLRAMQAKFKKGYWLWQAPYGYKRDQETREIVIDDDAAKVVTEIFHKLSVVKREDRQQTVVDLANKYNFPISRIEKIVDNSFYAGEMCSTTWDMFVMGRHTPLVDFETLRRAQK